jgi:hypothetical protein
MGLGQMAQDFRAGPRKPFITGAETISVDYKVFSDFSNHSSLCGVKSQLAWAKRPNAAWKRVKNFKGPLKIKGRV